MRSDSSSLDQIEVLLESTRAVREALSETQATARRLQAEARAVRARAREACRIARSCRADRERAL